MDITSTIRTLVFAAYEQGWHNACSDHIAQSKDAQWPIGQGKHSGVDSVLIELDPNNLLGLRR